MTNKITIHGRLTADPELRKAGDKSVASFTIACDRDFGEKKADFFNCVAWEKKAEHISSYFGKGQEAIVNGRLQTRSYADKESGKQRTVYEIVVESIDFCGKKGDYETPERPKYQPTFEDLGDDGGELPF